MKHALVLLSLLSLVAANAAQAETPRGQAEYVRYCSACHGVAADGEGPLATVMKIPPSALTRLRDKYGQPLGTRFVAYVMGKTMPRAHGTSAMPVWGKNLAEDGGDDTQAVQTIWKIAAYLDSIQSE